MRAFTLVNVLAVVFLSSMSLNSYADAQNIVSIKKITTLSGSDAHRFKKLFGENLSASNRVITIECNKKTCEITTIRSGFADELAKHLLNGRKQITYQSDNKKFKLQCGEAGVAYCNVSQEDAILK
jgi:hypothetical protein